MKFGEGRGGTEEKISRQGITDRRLWMVVDPGIFQSE